MSLFSKKSPLSLKTNKKFTKKRSLRMEALEERQMLSISDPTDAFTEAAFDNLTEKYSSLDFLSYTEYDNNVTDNIQVVPVEALANASLLDLQLPPGTPLPNAVLQQMLDGAALGGSNDLIVIAVSGSQGYVYDLTTQAINVTGKDGSLTVVVWNTDDGDATFSLDTTGSDRHFTISGNSTEVQFGGIDFTNSASVGGGVVVSGGATLNLDSVSLVGCVAPFIGNGNNGASEGGAINTTNSTVNIFNSEFTSNSATGANSGNFRGGAIYANNSTVNVTQSDFIGNTAEDINSNNFSGNGYGGAIYTTGASGNVVVSQSLFIGNIAEQDGGAVYQQDGTLKVNNSLFAANNANRGSAVFVDHLSGVSTTATTEIVSCTVAGNNVVSGGTGAIDFHAGNAGNNRATKKLYNTIFYNNDAGSNKYDYWIDDANGTIEVGNNLYTGNGLGGANLNSGGGWDKGGNERVTVGQLSLTTDWHLNYDSVAIDKITNSSHQAMAGEFDLDGNTRVVGTGMDVGAFEYQGLAFYKANDDTVAISISDQNDPFFVLPVYDAVIGQYTFTVSLADGLLDYLFWNDDILVSPPAFEIVDGGSFVYDEIAGTITFFWDMSYGLPNAQTFQYRIGDRTQWTDYATVSVYVNKPESVYIVTTCDDLNRDVFDPVWVQGENFYQDPLLSLREAITFANANDNSVIFFAPYLADGEDLTGFEDDGIITLEFGRMDITSNVVIVGLGADVLTIDAEEASQIFYIGDYVYDSQTNTFSDITEIDVAINGLTLINATGNNDQFSWGGAIHASYTNLLLNDVDIFDSSAVRGGAIFSNFGSLSVSNSNMQGNEATQMGGAIWRRDSGGNSTTYIDNVTFTDNKVIDVPGKVNNYGGGAIYFALQSVNALTIVNSAFYNNDANYGGAIDARGGSVNINNSIFENNSATYGGAVFATCDTSISGKDTLFNLNVAERGGALYSFFGTLNVSEIAFTKNSAEAGGGAIYRRGADGSSVSDVTFTGNTAVSGGAIHVSVVSTETMIITDSTFESNHAISETGLGGAIDFTGSGKLDIQSTDFVRNTASIGGGAIYHANAALEISANSNFDSNTVGDPAQPLSGGGGAIFSRNGTLDVSDTNFSSNEALSGNGGAVYRRGTSGSSFTDVSFTGSTSVKYGGAIFIPAVSNEIMNIERSTFENNSSSSVFGSGGAISIQNGELNISDSVFDTNAAFNGGAVYATNSTLEISTSNILNNTAEKFGGAVYSENGTLTLNANSFAENEPEKGFSANSAVSGGAVYRLGSGISSIDACLFTGNTASSTGGAICFASASDAIMTITDSTFKSNHAISETGFGGAIIFTGSGTLAIQSTDFVSNEASIGGGAIYHANAALEISANSNFDSNTVGDPAQPLSGGGGAIYSINGTLDVSDTNFSSNEALSGNGGAVYRRGTSGSSFTDVSFADNTSVKYGGAIFIPVASDEIMQLVKVDFYGNTTQGQGGGMFIANGHTDLFDCYFNELNEAAANSGSGIYARAEATLELFETDGEGTTIKQSGGLYQDAMIKILEVADFDFWF